MNIRKTVLSLFLAAALLLPLGAPALAAVSPEMRQEVARIVAGAEGERQKTERVFAWPGMGTLFYDSISKHDFPILMGILMVNAFLVILANLLADILYAVLDPRIKY